MAVLELGKRAWGLDGISLRSTHMAIENGPFVVDSPTKSGAFPQLA